MPVLHNIVCPRCDMVCRVMAPSAAHCEICHAALFTGAPVSLDDPLRFRRHIVSNDIAVLVAFGAPWCGPCRVIAAEINKAAAKLEPEIRFASVDISAAPKLEARYDVRALPTFVLFHRGQEIARRVGTMQAPEMARFVADHLHAEERLAAAAE